LWFGNNTVVMVLVLGQSRVAFAMSRDNLLPPWFSRVHRTFRTPHRITIITGIAPRPCSRSSSRW
jgi:APA family basic amino acid/polyamine antiporter